MPSPAGPSAAAILYLFADRVVEPDTALSQKFVVPCADVAVKRQPLAGELFAISFWSLQDQGKLTLTMGERTLLGLGRQQITASIQPGTAAPAPPQGPQMMVDLNELSQAGGVAGALGKMLEGLGQQVSVQGPAAPPEPGVPPFTLEDATLHQVHLHGGVAPVRDVIRAWFGSDESDPHGSVIDRVARELTELGYATGVDQGSILTPATITVDCERRGAVEASATEVLERWRAFRDAPDGLGSTLVDRCRAAVSSRTEGDSAD